MPPPPEGQTDVSRLCICAHADPVEPRSERQDQNLSQKRRIRVPQTVAYGVFAVDLTLTLKSGIGLAQHTARVVNEEISLTQRGVIVCLAGNGSRGAGLVTPSTRA